MPNHQHTHSLKHKISISGAAVTECCSIKALTLAEEVGKQLALHDVITITGATSGIPYWTAKGAKEAGGLVIGYSPASSELAHVKTYKLPLDYHDVILFTGFEYVGRDLLIVKSADAAIFICGRIGTLHEFTAAFEEQKPIGVMLGSGGTADKIKDIVEGAGRGPGKIVYDSDPKALVEQVVAMVEKEKGQTLEEIEAVIHEHKVKRTGTGARG